MYNITYITFINLYCICINIMYKINMRTIYTVYNAHVHCTLYQMYNYIYSNMTI